LRALALARERAPTLAYSLSATVRNACASSVSPLTSAWPAPCGSRAHSHRRRCRTFCPRLTYSSFRQSVTRRPRSSCRRRWRAVSRWSLRGAVGSLK
jgi:hypothetical protein